MGIFGAIIDFLFPYSLDESIERFERSNGSADDAREALMFEAVCWVLSSFGNARLALERFDNDFSSEEMSESCHDQVRRWLSRWASAVRPTLVAEA